MGTIYPYINLQTSQCERRQISLIQDTQGFSLLVRKEVHDAKGGCRKCSFHFFLKGNSQSAEALRTNACTHQVQFPATAILNKAHKLLPQRSIQQGGGPRIESLWQGWRKRCPLSVGVNGRLFS
eukprot:1143046-Pelagomonas_calceolata.AAC.7